MNLCHKLQIRRPSCRGPYFEERCAKQAASQVGRRDFLAKVLFPVWRMMPGSMPGNVRQTPKQERRREIEIELECVRVCAYAKTKVLHHQGSLDSKKSAKLLRKQLTLNPKPFCIQPAAHLPGKVGGTLNPKS